jgi:hypothetical protein
MTLDTMFAVVVIVDVTKVVRHRCKPREVETRYGRYAAQKMCS